jgi:hypothetical protein
MLSVLVHGIAYGVLLLLASRGPSHVSLSPTAAAKGTLNSDKVGGQVGEAEQSEVEVSRRHVDQLVAMRRQLQQIRDVIKKQLGKRATTLAENAPRNIQTALQQASNAQSKVRQAQAEAVNAQAKASAARRKTQQADATMVADVHKAQQEAAIAQSRALAAQEQVVAAQQTAARITQFAGEPFAPVKTALEEASHKQKEAQDAQKQAGDALARLQERLAAESAAHGKAQQARQKFAAVEKKSQQAAAQAESTEHVKEAAQKTFEDVLRRADEPAHKADEARRTVEQAEPANMGRQRARAGTAARQSELAQHKRDEAEARLKQTQQQTEMRRREADAARDEARRAQDDLNREEAALRDRSQVADAAQKDSAAVQAQAAQKQAEAQRVQIQASRVAMQVSATVEPGHTKTGEAKKKDATAVAAQGATRSAKNRKGGSSSAASGDSGIDLKTKGIADLFDIATATEKEIAELDRQIRAANLAMATQVPYSEALAQTDAAAPLRELLDRNLLSGQDGNGAARNEQVAQARAQIAGMVSSGQRMLARSGGAPGDRQRVSRRSGATATRPGGPAAQVGTGPVGVRGTAIDPVRDARMMLLAQQDKGQPKDLTGAMKSLSAGSIGSPSDNPRHRPVDGGPEPVGAYRAPEVASEAILQKAIPGRRVTAKGQGAEWMFVNSWYTIGPFSNEGRANLHRRFAPESVVDLDATYVGKDNRPVRWQFAQNAAPMLRPAQAAEYAIYYAYSELWFDEPRDLWIAIGSDDASTIWIEGQMVWRSRDDLKSWNAGEGLRRVHFKKGLNRVLYRLENGWGESGLSLVIQVKPSLQQ